MDNAKYRYNHIGIPTTVPHPGERYLPELKMYVYGYETNDFNIEWMRFDADSSFPDLVKNVPHVAFEVDDLDAALAGREVIIAPNFPCPEVRVAFIRENDAPVELMQFIRPAPEINHVR